MTHDYEFPRTKGMRTMLNVAAANNREEHAYIAAKFGKELVTETGKSPIKPPGSRTATQMTREGWLAHRQLQKNDETLQQWGRKLREMEEIAEKQIAEEEAEEDGRV